MNAVHPPHKMVVDDLSVFYGAKQAIDGIDMTLLHGSVTALIGPSGCGKTTYLMSLNRLVESIPGVCVHGKILLDGVNLLSANVKLQNIRRRVGLIFQKPNPFPLSIYNNVALGLREHGLSDRHNLEARVEESLRSVGLWAEVKDRLHRSALSLSGGQQQRLCIARAVALKPEVLLLDEPCSALDPIASARVEDLIHELAPHYTILVVTHNLGQARRLSTFTAFFYASEDGVGRLVEQGPTVQIFESPAQLATRDYVSGRIG